MQRTGVMRVAGYPVDAASNYSGNADDGSLPTALRSTPNLAHDKDLAGGHSAGHSEGASRLTASSLQVTQSSGPTLSCHAEEPQLRAGERLWYEVKSRFGAPAI